MKLSKKKTSQGHDSENKLGRHDTRCTSSGGDGRHARCGLAGGDVRHARCGLAGGDGRHARCGLTGGEVVAIIGIAANTRTRLQTKILCSIFASSISVWTIISTVKIATISNDYVRAISSGVGCCITILCIITICCVSTTLLFFFGFV